MRQRGRKIKPPLGFQGPLTGVNVIDFGHYYAGPMAGMLLADQGATVIRIVKPGRPEISDKQYHLLNRNKKLLTLNLKSEEEKILALSLIKKADVVIENFRPGVMKRLGLDYAAIKGINPSVIYLSMPGFASTDKERAHIQAWEGVLAAAAGIFTHMGRYRQSLNFPPVFTWVPLCSSYGGMQGAQAVMAAMVARQKHGSGALIETPLVDAGLSSLSGYFTITPLLVQRTFNKLDDELPDFLKPFVYKSGDSYADQLEKLKGVTEATNPSPFYIEPQRCADGRHLVVCMPDKQAVIARYLKVLGIDEQLRREGFQNEGPWVTGIDNNMSNAGQFSAERKERLTILIKGALLTKTAQEWERILAGVGVSGIMLRTRDEWLALEPLMRSGIFCRMKLNDSVLTVPGRIVDVGGPNDTLMSPTQKAPEIIYPSELEKIFNNRIQNASSASFLTQKKGDMLEGLKVLDLSSVLAGPTGSYYLSQYGADVIRVEPPDGVNGPGGMDFGEIAQGKRTILVDVKTAPGQEVFHRLVSWADVLIHNCLDDVAERLGVTQAQLKLINPSIVSCQMSAFGGSYRGGWEKRPGYDALAQAACGIMAQFGTLEDPHYHAMTASADILSGIAIAYTCLLAVYQQRESGIASEGRTSLARVINYAQLPYMISENGSSDQGEDHGQFAVGNHWWQRMYACLNGWIYVGTYAARSEVLLEVVTGQTDFEVQALEEKFAERDCSHWVERLANADIACHRVLTLSDVLRAKKVRAVSNDSADETAHGPLEIMVKENHPSGKAQIVATPSWVRVGEQQSYRRRAAPARMGSCSREILAELGYEQAEIEELIRLRIAHEFHPGVGNKEDYFFTPESLQ